MKRKNLDNKTWKIAALLTLFAVSTAFSPGPRKIYFQNIKTKKIDSTTVDFYGNTKINQLPTGTFRVSFISKLELIKFTNDKKANIPVYTFRKGETYHFDNHLFVLANNVDISSHESPGIKVNYTKKTVKGERHPVAVMRSPSMETRLTSPEISMEKSSGMSDFSTDDIPISSSPDKSKSVRAGIVTAGRWSDLENWSKFHKTHDEPSIKSIQKEWGFDLLHKRVSIKLTTHEGGALPLQKLQLRNKKDSVLWTSLTDNSGSAELWIHPFSNLQIDKKEKFGVYHLTNERWVFLGNVSGDVNSIEEYRLNLSQPIANEVDVCFVVDATGSMGDEIQYLQKELIDFSLNANKELPCSKIRLSSVFYRDLGDEYVSKKADFTDRIEDIMGFISEQSAGGGGDFPEAVDAGLNSAIHELNWSKSAIAKIIFLVLDAPPHIENASKIRELTAIASQKGIKIIPITASGINTSTEFLMKYIASITGGEYLYITDHSGVGNSHLAPTGVKENVDLLKNQWMNVLLKYAKYGDCEKLVDSQQLLPIMDPRRNIFGNQQVIIETYPNPASNFIEVESNSDILGIKWYDMNHRLVVEVKNDQPSKKKRFEFPVQIPGLYLLEVNTYNGTFINKTLLTNGYKS